MTVLSSVFIFVYLYFVYCLLCICLFANSAVEQGERLVWRWQSRLDHPTVNMGNLLLEESSRKFYSFAHNQPDHDLMTENDNLSKSNILRTKMLTLSCWKGMCGILIELDDGWISPVSISVTDFDLWALLSHGWLVEDILLLLLWTFVHLNIASKWGSFPDYDDYGWFWWSFMMTMMMMMMMMMTTP